MEKFQGSSFKKEKISRHGKRCVSDPEKRESALNGKMSSPERAVKGAADGSPRDILGVFGECGGSNFAKF